MPEAAKTAPALRYRDLSQSRLRHLAQHVGDDPQCRPSSRMSWEYLKSRPTRGLLVQLAARMGASLSALLREKGTPYAELGLDKPRSVRR